MDEDPNLTFCRTTTLQLEENSSSAPLALWTFGANDSDTHPSVTEFCIQSTIKLRNLAPLKMLSLGSCKVQPACYDTVCPIPHCYCDHAFLQLSVVVLVLFRNKVC